MTVPVCLANFTDNAAKDNQRVWLWKELKDRQFEQKVLRAESTHKEDFILCFVTEKNADSSLHRLSKVTDCRGEFPRPQPPRWATAHELYRTMIA